MVGEAVQQSPGQAFRAEYLRPLIERQVGGHQDRAPLVALAEDFEQPRLPADQRYTNAYLFGAICPRSGKGAALMLPFANTRAMQMHLDEISCNVAAKAHGVVLMDRAGWHSTGKLKVPKNLTIILLPSRSPELNPVENIWQYLRQNWLSNRVFEDYHAIIEAGCQAWNKLIDQPETIMSIGLRDWAHTGR